MAVVTQSCELVPSGTVQCSSCTSSPVHRVHRVGAHCTARYGLPTSRMTGEYSRMVYLPALDCMRCWGSESSRFHMHDDDPSVHAGTGLVTPTAHLSRGCECRHGQKSSNKSTTTSPPAAARYDMIATAY